MKSLNQIETENALAAARASRLGLNARCPACGAQAGEGCRGENGMPQSAWTHNARIGIGGRR